MISIKRINILHIFDLDYTLVQYCKRKVSVPRQTHHALRALHGTMCIISFNPLANFIAHLTGLNKYISYIICDPHNTRIELMKRLFLLMNKSFSSIHYWDDRLDNIQCIETYYPFIHTHHVTDPCLLYRDLKLI